MTQAKVATYFVTKTLAKECPFEGIAGITATPSQGRMMHRRINPLGKGALFRGFVLSGSRKALERYKKKFGLSFEALIQTKSAFQGLLARKAPESAVSVTDHADRVKRAPDVIAEITNVLHTFAGITGYRFNVLIDEGPSVPPFPKEAGVLNVVLGASAPGATGSADDATLCGVQLNHRRYYVYRRTPAKGRGIILTDEDGLEFAQIVDTTIYLLVPVANFEAFLLLDSVRGSALFQKAFIPSWDAFISPHKHRQKKPEPLTNARAFGKRVFDALELRQIAVRTSIQTQERYVEERLQKYLEAVGKLTTLRDLERGVEKDAAELPARFQRDWKRLSTHPAIKSIEIEGNALYFKTHTLFIEHEEVRYRLGAYTIRYTVDEMASIWAHESAHPKSVAHPHISPNGTVCFGNVTKSVYEAGMRMEIGDMVETILRWVTDGYTPSLADTKIEEWPAENSHAKL